TVYVEHYGGTPNYLSTVQGYDVPGSGILPPLTLCNLSARYQFTPQIEASFAVDNVFDTGPPVDHSYPGTAGDYSLPAYDVLDYNIYGRTFFIEANYHFGK
ncbi:MAG TPA: hypothetical protein VGL28_07000, partial [Steroidobacteraceae bacterium]